MCTLVNESERKKKRPGSSDVEALWVIKIGDCKGLVINDSKRRFINIFIVLLMIFDGLLEINQCHDLMYLL